MKVILEAPHVEVPEKLKDYAREKVSRFERLFQNIPRVEVRFDQDGAGSFRSRICVYLPKHKTIVCTESGANFVAALDVAAEAVERRLTEEKEKLRRRGDRERVTRRLPRRI